MVVTAKAMECHLWFDCAICPETAILCVCGEMIVRGERESHVEEDLVKHIIALENRNAVLEDKLEEAESERKRLKRRGEYGQDNNFWQ